MEQAGAGIGSSCHYLCGRVSDGYFFFDRVLVMQIWTPCRRTLTTTLIGSRSLRDDRVAPGNCHEKDMEKADGPGFGRRGR